MTNPDNVGGLFYPSGDDVDQMIELAIQCGIDNRGTSWPVTLCRLRAKVRAELCRAAPAGGDVPDARDEQEYDDELCFPEHEVEAMKLEAVQDSAPAGSGEVEELAQRLDGYEQRSACMAHWSTQSGQRDDADYWSQHAKDMNTAAALLRKLQQGAEYSPNSVAKRKRVEIEALGYVCNGVSFMHPETGRRGLLDDLGAVHWMASQGQEGGHG